MRGSYPPILSPYHLVIVKRVDVDEIERRVGEALDADVCPVAAHLELSAALGRLAWGDRGVG